MDVGKRGLRRHTRVLRGVAVATILAVGGFFALIGSAGLLTELPSVRAVVPVAGSPLTVHAPVQYRGVVVGKLESIDPVKTEAGDSRIELRIEPEQLSLIPSSVRVRTLPRTVFGDQFVDLVDAAPRSSRQLHDGQTIRADRSKGTVDLYATYQRAYRLLTRLRPAQLNQVLTALSTLLAGHGEQIGRLIDRATHVSGKLMPLAGKLTPLMHDIADTAGKLRKAAPDMYAALHGAVRLSKFVAKRQRDIATMLTGGAAGSTSAQQLLSRNQNNIITLVHTGSRLGSAFAAHPDGLNDIMLSLAELGNATDGVSHKTTIRLHALDPYNSKPYTSNDCPRYPGRDGPNCSRAAPPDLPLSGAQSRPQRSPSGQAPAGNVGSAGSADEIHKLRSLLPKLTGTKRQPPKSADGILDAYLGPIFRGSTVVTR